MTAPILLLEDDVVLSKEIISFLEKHNYSCDPAYDGSDASLQSTNKDYELVILDINVPIVNGFEVCKQIRKENKLVRILMLTAFGEIEDKIKAFDLGADDYLVKPFHFDELLIRIKSLLRRKEVPQRNEIRLVIDDLVIDVENREVQRNGVLINLSPKEFNLLMILANANGRVLSKKQISDELWDYHIETNLNSIEVYINFLRKKIELAGSKKLIHTKVGFGYYLKSE